MAASFPIVGKMSTTDISTHPLNLHSSPGPMFATVQMLPDAGAVSSIYFTMFFINELETEAAIIDASEISRVDCHLAKLETSR
jgi:hypothetical protein